MKFTAIVHVHSTEETHVLHLDCQATQRSIDLAVQKELLKWLKVDNDLEADATVDDVVNLGYDIQEVKIGHWHKDRPLDVWNALPFDEESMPVHEPKDSSGTSLRFSYDSFGINDANDPYKARLLTFSDAVPEEKRKLIGGLIEAMPEILNEFANVLPGVEAHANAVATTFGASHDYAVMWQSALQKAREAIAKGNSGIADDPVDAASPKL